MLSLSKNTFSSVVDLEVSRDDSILPVVETVESFDLENGSRLSISALQQTRITADPGDTLVFQLPLIRRTGFEGLYEALFEGTESTNSRIDGISQFITDTRLIGVTFFNQHLSENRRQITSHSIIGKTPGQYRFRLGYSGVFLNNEHLPIRFPSSTAIVEIESR